MPPAQPPFHPRGGQRQGSDSAGPQPGSLSDTQEGELGPALRGPHLCSLKGVIWLSDCDPPVSRWPPPAFPSTSFQELANPEGK